MTPEQFVMWLKGYVDAKRGSDMAIEDWADITAQLETVATGFGNPFVDAYRQQMHATGLGSLANAAVNRVGNFDVKKG